MKVDRRILDKFVKNTHIHAFLGETLLYPKCQRTKRNNNINLRTKINKIQFFLHKRDVFKRQFCFKWEPTVTATIRKCIQKLIGAECVPIRHNYLTIKTNNKDHR